MNNFPVKMIFNLNYNCKYNYYNTIIAKEFLLNLKFFKPKNT